MLVPDSRVQLHPGTDQVAGVALLGAGGLSGVVQLWGMAQGFCDRRDVAMAAGGAGFPDKAVLGAGGGEQLLGVGVPLGLDEAVLVAVTADGTGVDGVTHMGAVCLYQMVFVGVIRQGNGLLVGLAAVGAGEGADAFLGAGGFPGDTLHIAVLQSRDVVAPVAVVTVGAGIGGVAHGVAGGRGHLADIVVAGGRDQVSHMAVAADGAGVGGISASFAGGCGYLAHIRMTGSRDQMVHIAVAAHAASMSGVAHVLTGGCGDRLHVVVAVAGMEASSTSPQRVQVRVWVPGWVQVGARPVVHWVQLWAGAGV